MHVVLQWRSIHVQNLPRDALLLSPVDTEELGTKELVFGEKKFYIDAKSNEQGQFMRIVEVSVRRTSKSAYRRTSLTTACINNLIYT